MRIDNPVLALPYDRGKADALLDAVLNESGAAALDSDHGRALVRSMAGNSPHLARLIDRHRDILPALLASGPEPLLADELGRLQRLGEEIPPPDALMKHLRIAKARISLIAAAADIAGLWPLARVTDALSSLAALALDLALARLVHDRITSGELEAAADYDPKRATLRAAARSGLFVLGMGKLGAYELNYSSDIDLIVLYDEEVARPTGKRPLSDVMIRITRDLVRVIEARTADGYVFRTDLRLRPDPGATAVALSVGAAETYYQSVALNWERAAMIKARVVAGDAAAGAAYLDRLTPFIWRRSLDYAAIEDIHAIKDQIHRHHGHKGLNLPGFDVKLGPGGIREIEFYAQINQLIAGGRDPSLRVRGTMEALDRLVACSRVGPDVRDELVKAYVFLRTVEHRLQMIEDAQTHSLPEDDQGMRRIALFSGFKDSDSFTDALLGHLKTVQRHYDGLLPDDFGKRESLPLAEIEALLTGLGYKAPDNAIAIIDRWRRGRYRALRTPRARRLFEATLKPLLEAFAANSEPDSALARFDAFLAQLPQGVQLFALFQANPALFRLVGRIMGIAPALAEILAKRPQLVDSFLDPDFFLPLPSREALRADLDKALAPARDYQDVLDIVRRWTNDHRFRLGVQALEGLADIRELSESMTAIADIVIDRLEKDVAADYAVRHGVFPDGALAVVAMGKFGGRELSFGSDLDIVLLYAVEGDAQQSDGPKPFQRSRYFSGLGQALITALTAMTPEGRLFEVDTRLRPSGSAGPLVVTFSTFADYYREAAWTWEHMALTRARVISAPPAMAGDLRALIRTTLAAGHDHAALLPAVAEMRLRLAREFRTQNPWSVKHVRGGLVDMEFIVQYLLLREGAAHPDIFTPRLDDCIQALEAIGALDRRQATMLVKAHGLCHMTQSLLRLSLGADCEESHFSPELRAALVRASAAADFDDLKTGLLAAQAAVRDIYGAVIDGPLRDMAGFEEKGETT